MTVSNTTNKTSLVAGDGIVVAFGFSFPVLDETHSEVYKVVTSTNVQTLQTLNVDYTVSINPVTEGGTVTYTVAPTSLQSSFIKRVVPYTQPTDLITVSNLSESSLERAYDRGVMQAIQVQEETARALGFDIDSTTTGVVVPEPEANTYLGWNTAATNLENKASLDGSVVSIPALSGNGGKIMAVNSGGTALEYVLRQGFVSATDTTSGYLQDKALGGDGVAATVLNSGADEELIFAVDLATTPGLEFDSGKLKAKDATAAVKGVASFNTTDFTVTAGAVTLKAGATVQVVNTQTGAVATGTTLIPLDNTIPQNTEGDEYMTLAITPTNASNKLRIDVVVNASTSNGGARIAAVLFQDAAAAGIAAANERTSINSEASNISYSHTMVAGTTLTTTFKVRIGGTAAGTITFNGTSGGGIFGGIMASSITITEIKV